MSETPPQTDVEKLALKTYLMATFAKLAGCPAQLVRDVDRMPHFNIPAGATGTVLGPALDDEGRIFLALQLDDPPEGSDPFDGELHWLEDYNLTEFEDDVMVDVSHLQPK